jgi:hypothetical protein
MFAVSGCGTANKIFSPPFRDSILRPSFSHTYNLGKCMTRTRADQSRDLLLESWGRTFFQDKFDRVGKQSQTLDIFIYMFFQFSTQSRCSQLPTYIQKPIKHDFVSVVGIPKILRFLTFVCEVWSFFPGTSWLSGWENLYLCIKQVCLHFISWVWNIKPRYKNTY